MAITYAYPTVVPELQDLLIGTEMATQGGEDAPRTRTFTIGSVVDLIETTLQSTPTLQQVTTAGPTSTRTISLTPQINTPGLVVSGSYQDDGLISVYSADIGMGISSRFYDGTGIYVEGNSSGAGIGISVQAWNGYGIVCNSANSTPARFNTQAGSIIAEFAKANIVKASISGDGNVSANSFIKISGTATQSLMANGTTRNISIFNNSNPTQVLPADTDTYLVGSNISTGTIKAGSIVNWDIAVVKTAAGVAPPVFTVRFGTAGTVSDSVLLIFTGSAQTAVADGGVISIKCTFKTVGSGTGAVLAGYYTLIHNGGNTGLSTVPVNFAFQTSAGFNSTLNNAVLGISIDSGLAAAWTVNQVTVKLENQL